MYLAAMLALLVCISCNVAIFFCFRMFQRLRIETFQAITVNYAVCVIIGVLIVGWTPFLDTIRPPEPWLLPAGILGLIFIVTFFLMARTTQEFSMTVASIASKMSLVIPVLVSFFLLGTRVKEYTWLNIAGILLAMLAIFFSSVRRSDPGFQNHGARLWYLPVLVFLLGGLIDTSLNYLNLHHVKESQEGIFPIWIFLFAALSGSVFLMFKRTGIQAKALAGGAVLGCINYFSMYSLLAGLSAFGNDGAFFFSLLNVGIILLAAGISRAVFSERISGMNLSGLILAVLAIVLISYQEILPFFGL